MQTYATAYNFSNIRYAAPPVGDLRFRAPVPPAENRSQVQNGTQGHACPQASPLWQEIAEPFLESYFEGKQFNQSSNISSYSYQPEPVGSGVSEDCLFLDVLAPKKAFDRGQKAPQEKLAPVLVWIYGGGYTTGDKSTFDALGLMTRSRKHGEEIVYVALNYRVSMHLNWAA